MTEIKWNTTELPDADIAVVLRLQSDEWPLSIGHWDGECYRSDEGHRIDRVKAWIHLHDAARILDGGQG